MYHEGRLRLGYPKLIEQEFPGIPADLDAAVECHPKECPSETIVFFKGKKGSLTRGSKAGLCALPGGGSCLLLCSGGCCSPPPGLPSRPPPALTHPPFACRPKGIYL